jgi:hypothetical protein
VVVTIAYRAHIIAMFTIELFFEDELRTAFGTAITPFQRLSQEICSNACSVVLKKTGSFS